MSQNRDTIFLSGWLLREKSDELKAELLELSNQLSVIKLDLRAVVVIGSSFLGILALIHRIMQKKSGELKILNPSKIASEVFHLTHMDKMLTIVNEDKTN